VYGQKTTGHKTTGQKTTKNANPGQKTTRTKDHPDKRPPSSKFFVVYFDEVYNELCAPKKWRKVPLILASAQSDMFAAE